MTPQNPAQCYWCWMLWFFAALALRENILKVNGSSIRSWWIRHHYYSMAVSAVVLTMQFDSPACQVRPRPSPPRTASPAAGACAPALRSIPEFTRRAFHRQAFIVRFLYCAVLQGFIMLLQNSYQRRRTYTRIALGRANAMDVVSGGEETSGQLKTLYPLLFTLNIIQATNGLVVLRVVKESFSPDPASKLEWQACVCGCLFLIMAVGDFTQTARSLLEKRRRSKGRRAAVVPPPTVTPPPAPLPAKGAANKGGKKS